MRNSECPIESHGVPFEKKGKLASLRSRSTSRSKILTWSSSASEHGRDMVLVAKPMFWGMGNHLGPFSEASDQPEGQELGGRAVGGQERLQEVKF